MISTIEGFREDDDGDWVAALSCLHSQHVRHHPPFQERPWVVTEAGRSARVGAPLECPLCDRLELPAGLEVVRTAGPFDTQTMPSALQRAHRVAARTWGLLCVLEGTVGFSVETMPPISRRVAIGEKQPIPPDVAHELRVDGPVRLAVDFLVRRAPSTGS
jgi:tellurite resistance-related uncharacterized protein